MVNLELEALRSFAATCQVSVELAQRHLGAPLKAESFRDRECGLLWEFMRASLARGEEPTLSAAYRALSKNVAEAKLKAVFLEAKEHHATKKRLLEVASDAEVRALKAQLQRQIEELDSAPIGQVRRNLAALASEGNSEEEEIGGQALVAGYADEMERRYRTKEIASIPTGIKAFDGSTGGLPRSITIIGALTGVGKSSLCAGMVRNICRRGVKVGVLSLEDNVNWLMNRWTALETGIPVRTLSSGLITGQTLEAVTEAAGNIHNWASNLLVSNVTKRTIDQVMSVATGMVLRGGVKVLVVDHLGEINPGKVTHRDRHDLEVASIVSDLRSLANMYGVAVVVFSQLRREEGFDMYSCPQRNSFANSAEIERKARLLVGLSRVEGTGNEDSLRINIIKQTIGPAGSWGLARVDWNSTVVLGDDV